MGTAWSYITDTSPVRLSHKSRKIKDNRTITKYVQKKKQNLKKSNLSEFIPSHATVATSAHSLCLVNKDSDTEHRIFFHCLVDNLSYSQVEALCLCKHNALRFRHKVPALKLNPELSTLAEHWANKIAEMKMMKESPFAEYGENMCFSEKSNISIDTIIQHWYDEIELYDFNDPHFCEETGHFTQIVWRNTKELGVGLVSNEHGTFVVILYCPPGNYDDHFYDNVPPPLRNKCSANMYYNNKI